MILWTWTAALSGFVLFPLFAPESNAIIPFAAIVLGLLLYTLFHPGLRIERRRTSAGVRRCARRTPRPGTEAASREGRRRRPGPAGVGCRWQTGPRSAHGAGPARR